MKEISKNASRFLVIWFGLLFISPLFGIHIHHILPTTQDEITIIHSYYESDHNHSSNLDESEAQSLFEHISPYGISSDLGDWDGSIVMETNVFILLIAILLLVSFINLNKLFNKLILYQPNKINFEIAYTNLFLKKSYIFNCLINNLPPPSLYK